MADPQATPPPPLPPLQKPPGYRSRELSGSVSASISPSRIRPSPFRVHTPKKPGTMLPQSFRRPSKERDRRCCCCSLGTCCCYTFLVFLIILILLAVASCIFFLWFSPELPKFHLQSVNFRYFNVTDGPDGSYLTAEAMVKVETRNPNTVLRLNYGKTDLNLKVDDVEMGEGSLPGFMQGKKNTTVLKFLVDTNNLLLESGKARRLQTRFKSKSLVVEAEVHTAMGLGIRDWRTWKAVVVVLCGGKGLNQVEVGAPHKCRFKWISISI